MICFISIFQYILLQYSVTQFSLIIHKVHSLTKNINKIKPSLLLNFPIQRGHCEICIQQIVISKQGEFQILLVPDSEKQGFLHFFIFFFLLNNLSFPKLLNQLVLDQVGNTLRNNEVSRSFKKSCNLNFGHLFFAEIHSLAIWPFSMKWKRSFARFI